MSPRRRLFERLAARSDPRFDPAFTPPPRALAPGLWSVDRYLEVPHAPEIPTRAVLVDDAGGGLVALSPVPLSETLRAQVEALGAVRWLVAPNPFHFLGVASWQAAWPGARTFVAPGLRGRRPDAPEGEEIAEGRPLPFADVLEHTLLAPDRGMSEVAFLHRPSRTLLLTDIAFHVTSVRRSRDRPVLKLMGMWEPLGPSLTARTALLRGRGRVADFLERVCRWDFERVVVAHGAVAEGFGPAELRAAFRRWLPGPRAAAQPGPR